MDTYKPISEVCRFILKLNVLTGNWMPNVSDIFSHTGTRLALFISLVVTDIISTVNLLTVISGVIVNMILSDATLVERCTSIFMFCSYFQCHFKIFFLFANRKNITSFVQLFDDSFKNDPECDETEKNIEKEMKFIKKYTLVGFSIIISAVSGWFTLPFVTSLVVGPQARYIAAPSYYPFDALVSPNFQIVASFQMISTLLMWIKTISSDCFFFTLISLQLVHLRQLKCRFEKIFIPKEKEATISCTKKLREDLGSRWRLQDFSSDEEDEVLPVIYGNEFPSSQNVVPQTSKGKEKLDLKKTPDGELKKELEKMKEKEFHHDHWHVGMIKEQLKLWIQHHQDIIRLEKKFDSLYGFTFAVVIGCTVLTMACIAFLIVADDNLNILQVPLLLSYFTFVTVQLYLYCHYGQLFITASLELSEVGFANGWHEHLNEKEIQSCLKIIHRQVQSPMKMTVLGVVDLNHETFVEIMNSVISYYMLLRKLHEK